MKKSLCLLVFVSALALLATSQTSSPSSRTNPSPPKPPTPVGSEQNSSSAASQSNLRAGGLAVQTSGTGSNTSGNTGPTSPGATSETPMEQTASENAIPSSQLQPQIQNALKNEPTLANDNMNVTVSDDEIDLSGRVATAKEKLTAKRIVQSYAGNRKVKDHLTLASHNASQ
jgi:hypothetical protein